MSESQDVPKISQVCKKIVQETAQVRYYDEWEDDRTCPWRTDDTKWTYDQTTVTAVVKRSLTKFKDLEMGESLPFTASYSVDGVSSGSVGRGDLVLGGGLIDEILDDRTDDMDDGATTIAFCTSILLSAMVIAY